jgi:Xaa-Pro aminopeptidase
MRATTRLLRDELSEKHNRVQRFLNQHNLDGVWLTRADNFAWYTGGGTLQTNDAYPPGQSGLLVTKDMTYLVANNIEGERLLQEEIATQPVELCTYEWYKSNARAELLAKLTNRMQIGTDTRWPNFVLVEHEFARLRFTLTPAEQYRYRGLCYEVTAIVQNIAHTVKQGQTEREVAAQIARDFTSAGITPNLLLVGADSRLNRYADPLPTDNRVCNYLMMVVVGARAGLQTALSRMAAVEHVPNEVEDRYQAVARIAARYVHHTRPGQRLGDILQAGAEAYTIEGYPGEWRTHIQGGVIGYTPRELEATPDTDQAIEPFQAVAWLSCIKGIRCEDTFLALPDRTEVLTRTNDWPVVEIQLEGETYYRPDILRL